MTSRLREPAIAPGSKRPNLVWFYVGALLGPYGGTTVAVLLTTLSGAYASDLATTSLAITGYMLAYAICLLFSGPLSDTFGTRITVTIGCALLGLGSVLCTVAPAIEFFLAGRVLQGVGNAFTTALLMASLGELVPSHRLGTSLGIFAAFQMAGSTFGPLGGGLAANLNWRLNFLFMAFLSAGLAVSLWRFYTAAGVGTRRGQTNPFRAFRDALSPRLGLLCLAAFVGYVGAPSIGSLAAIHLERTWGVPPAVNGLILAGFGLVNVLAAPKAGRWVDRLGRARVIRGGALAGAAIVAVEAIVPSPIVFALLLAVLGIPVVAAWTALGTIVVEAFPRQRGTATAIFSSAKFAGVAVAPAIFLPLYQTLGPTMTFWLVALVSGLMVVPVMLYGRLMAGTAEPR